MQISIRYILFLFLISLCCSTYCDAKQHKEAVIMVVLEGITIEQIARTESINSQSIFKSGSIGLMNNKVAGTTSMESNCATIGAGARTDATDTSHLSANADSKIFGQIARDAYRKITRTDPGNASVLHLGINELISKNTGRRYTLIPGLLGEELKASGVTTAIYGNSDLGSIHRRSAVSIAMDKSGQIAYGDVMADKFIPASDRPYQVKTDYQYIYNRIRDLNAERMFIVIEAGDTGRADNFSAISDKQRESMKLVAMKDCDEFITQMREYLKDNSDRYLLLAISADAGIDSARTGNKLTPIAISGSDYRERVLYSATTRRKALIANIDIAPTILDFYGIEPHYSMNGYPIKAVDSDISIQNLVAMNAQMISTYKSRKPILILYAILICFGLSLTILSISLLNQSKNAIFSSKTSRIVLTAIILIPLMLLLAPGFGIYNGFASISYLIIATIVCSIYLNHKQDDLRYVFIAVGAATAFTISADILCGSRLLMKSIMGYDSIVGMRYYGIGNEYTGVLIGSLLLALYSFYDLSPNIKRTHIIATIAICLIIIYIIGSPDYGTNFGGMLTALAAFGFAFTRIYDGIIRKKVILISIISGASLLALILAINVFTNNQSHIGSAITSGLQNGPSIFLDIAIRKWSMNLHLLGASIWAISLTGLILGLAVIFFWPVGILRNFLLIHPKLNAGFMGMVIGAIIAMLTNDSGVTMAATILFYLAIPLVLMIKVELADNQENPEALNPTDER